MVTHRSLAAAVFAAVLHITVFAQSNSSQNEILRSVDSLVNYGDSDFSAEYTISQEIPGRPANVTKAALFRRDDEEKYLILIMEPESDRGKGYLKIGNNLWLYDPVSRRFTVTSARDRFQNSNARNSDFTSSTLAEDYRVVSSSTERLGVYNTRVLELEAVSNDVTYPFMKIWVDENNLVRKFEDYSLSRQLLRTTAIPRYQPLGDFFVPTQIVIVDALAGAEVNGVFRNERTVISVAKPSFQNLPDLMFTQAYLERIGQ